MLIKGLDGKDYKLNLTKYLNKQRKNSSDLHRRAREILKTLYPANNIFEEVRLPGSKEPGRVRPKELYADFFIPGLGLIVEVHGQQHYDYNPHYHKNKLDFYLSVARDKTKRCWCEINNLIYIELPYNESDDEWRQRIESRRVDTGDT